jgi:hypothetical protein
METETRERPTDGPLSSYLTETQVAAALNRTRRSLSGWRRAGQGPAFVKIGPTILYPKDGLTAWLERITVDPSSRRSRRSA